MWIQQQYQQQQQQQQQPQTPTPQTQTPHSQPLLPLLPQHTQMTTNAAAPQQQPQQQQQQHLQQHLQQPQQQQQWQPQPTSAGYGYSPQGNGNAPGFGASHSSSQSLTTPLGYPKPGPPQQQHQHVASTMPAQYAMPQPPPGQYIYMPQALQQQQQQQPLQQQQQQQLPQQYAYAPQPSNSSSLQPQSSSGSGGAALSGAGASGAGQPTLVMLPNGTFALLQASPAASQASISGGSPGLPQHGGVTVGGHNGGITLPAAAASGFNSSQSAMSPLQQQQQQQQQPRYVQPQNLSFAGQQQHQMGSSQTQMPHIYIAPQQQPGLQYGASLTTMPTVQVGAGGMPTPPRAGLQLGSSSNSAGQSLSAMLAGSGNPSPNASATRMPANNFNASSSQSSRPLCDTSVWGYAVVDPYHQALQRVPVPPSVVLPTRGLKNYNNDVSLSSMKPCTSIMCMRYLAGAAGSNTNAAANNGANNTEGCPMDEQCHSFHVKHRYVEDARNCTDALCCGLHNCYYTREMMRSNCAPHMTDAKITLVLEDRSEVDVLPSQLAFTIGLDHLSIRGQSRVINMRKHVCRLHLEGRCKWTKDCGHVHLCREFHRALTAFHFPSLVFLLSTETDVQKLRAKLSEVAEFVGSRSCIPLTSHLLAAKRTVAVRCMTEAGALFTPGMARAAAAEFEFAVPEKQVLNETDFISDIFRAPGPPTRPHPLPDTVVAKPASTPPVQPLPMGVYDSAELTPGREGASSTPPSGAVESSSPGLTPQPTPAGGLSSEAASLPVALA